MAGIEERKSIKGQDFHVGAGAAEKVPAVGVVRLCSWR
jgi:hypothetical protein